MRRELNEIEYMNFSFGQPYNIVLVLRIHGELTLEALEEAFKKLQQRHPLLRVRIELDAKGMPWFTSEDVGTIPITVINQPEKNEVIKKEFHKQLVTHFDFENKEKPLFRVAFFPGQRSSDIILCGQHAICDGLSMIFLVRDLLHYLNNPLGKVEPLKAPTQDEDIFTPKVRRMVSKTPLRAYLLIAMLRIVHAFMFEVSKDKKKQQTKHDDIQIHSWNLSEKQTKLFLKKCKQEGVSVHSAICTAFLPDISTINNPVNLRGLLNFPIGESCGLYATGTVFKLKYQKQKDFWRNARRYQRKLILNLCDRKVFGIYRTFNKSVPLSFMSKGRDVFVDIVSRQNPFAVTNLGSLDRLGLVIDSDKFSLESFYGAVSSTFDAITVLVFTIRKKMYFHMHYLASVHNADELKQLAKRVVKRILES